MKKNLCTIIAAVIARVRVEYVGRAPIEGSSDDTMLMATLREGALAPAPSKVMVIP